MGIKLKDKTSKYDKTWLVNLQKCREEQGYTQVKLAMLTEISQQSVTYYETGTRTPSLEVAVRLAKVLGTSIDYLIGNDYIIDKYHYLNSDDKDTIDRMITSLNNKRTK